MIEFTHVTAVISAGVALWSIIRVEQVRKSTSAEELRKKFSDEIAAIRKDMAVEGVILREKVEGLQLKNAILDARVSPFLAVLDSKLAAFFHQPQNEYGLDRLIERYDADPTDAKWNLTDAELHTLIQHMELWHHRVKKDGPEPNETQELASLMWWGSMRGTAAMRQVLREHAHHDAREQQRRDAIQGYLQDAKTSFIQREHWWTRLLKYLRGFKS